MLISYELNIYSGFRFYSFKWCTFQLVWWCIFQLVYTVMAFPDEESARKISTLVLNKWTERQNLSVTKEEIHHSLSN